VTERGGEGYRFGRGLAGPWAGSDAGLKRCPGSSFMFLFLLFFSFSVFLFLVSFISFAKMLQFNSNQFLKFYKIHSKVLNQ
jgi:hypothetical protein